MAAVSTNLEPELSINDLSCVVNQLTLVSYKWEAIGLQIGVLSHVLEAIKLEHSRNPAHCLLGMLKKHLSNIDPQPCWERFVKALRSDAVGETALARKLEIKFCPLPETTSPETAQSHMTSDDPMSPLHPSPMKTSTASDQNQFPFLKPAEMSEDARETLYGRLSAENREMQRKFQSLVTATWEALVEKKVTPKELSNKLCCQSYESQIEKDSKKLLSECQEEIRKSESIDDAFFVMRNHYSFFNYELIDHIIQAFNLDRSCLTAYEDELSTFCKRRVCELPSKAYGTAVSTDSMLTIHLDSEFEKYTLNSLRAFRHRICEIFKVSYMEVRLIEVNKACVELVFAITLSLVDQLLPLSEEQVKSLRDEGVKHFEFKHPPKMLTVKRSELVPTKSDPEEQFTNVHPTEPTPKFPALKATPTLRELSLLPVADWYLMGLQIGVEEAALEDIERNYPRDARMAKTKMFGVWLRNCLTPNYLVLVEGLVAIGKRNVAHSLCSARGVNLEEVADDEEECIIKNNDFHSSNEQTVRMRSSSLESKCNYLKLQEHKDQLEHEYLPKIHVAKSVSLEDANLTHEDGRLVENSTNDCHQLDADNEYPVNDLEMDLAEKTQEIEAVVKRQKQEITALTRQNEDQQWQIDCLQKANDDLKKRVIQLRGQLQMTGIMSAIHSVDLGEAQETSSLTDCPLDPNLICPICGLQFKLGEIQMFRSHANNCRETSESGTHLSGLLLTDSHHRSDHQSVNKHPDSGFMSEIHTKLSAEIERNT